jgi:type I restriction enzyme S subunit
MAGDLINGEIPAHWEFTTLGEICQRGGGNIQSGPFGSQLHASDYVPVGVPSIMPTNIGENRIVEDGIVRITEEDANRLSQHRLRAGDIIYSRRGDVEKRALIREREEGWFCGTGCLKVRLGRGIVDPLFASLFLGHPAIREWIVRHAVGATMPNLNTAIMSAVPFALPPLAEQKAIASVLGALDDKIDSNRRMNATLEAMARALFQSWFVDFDPVRAKLDGRSAAAVDPATAALFPDSFQDSELGHIPKGWIIQPVGEVVDCVGGGTPSTAEAKYWEGGTHHWTTPKDFSSLQAPILLDTDRKLTDAGIAKISSGLLPAGTLLLSSRAPVGYCHRRHARCHQSGLHCDEVQRARLKLLHAELVPDEYGRDRKPRHGHHLRGNQQTELPPDSGRAAAEGTHGRLHRQSRAALRPNHRQPPPIPDPRYPARHAAAEAAERGVDRGCTGKLADPYAHSDQIHYC